MLKGRLKGALKMSAPWMRGLASFAAAFALAGVAGCSGEPETVQISEPVADARTVVLEVKGMT
jgi:hypothetical protein